MTKLNLSLSDLALSITVLIALVFCFSTLNGAIGETKSAEASSAETSSTETSSAETISKTKFQAFEQKIMAEYQTAKIRCASFVSDVRTFCDNKAEIEKDKSLADLASSYALQPQTIQPSDELLTEKTLATEQFNYKINPFNNIEFDQIYHVKA